MVEGIEPRKYAMVSQRIVSSGILTDKIRLLRGAYSWAYSGDTKPITSQHISIALVIGCILPDGVHVLGQQ